MYGVYAVYLVDILIVVNDIRVLLEFFWRVWFRCEILLVVFRLTTSELAVANF